MGIINVENGGLNGGIFIACCFLMKFESSQAL